MKLRSCKPLWSAALAAAALFTLTSAPAVPPRQPVLYAQAAPAAEAAVPAPAAPPAPADIAADTAQPERRRRSNDLDAIVRFGNDATLRSNETAEVVVLIGGDAQVDGKVREVLVVVGGDATVSGEVRGQVVAVGGDVRLLPGAKIGGDVVSVGGQVDADPTATVGGHIQQVSVGRGFPDLRWVRDWLVECVFKLRPLSFKVGWVWLVALGLLLVYLLTALALHRPVAACVRVIEERPATSFLTGLLGKLLVPFVVGLFAVTGIGLLGVPFLMAAVVVALLIGKVALFEYLGLQLGRLSGNKVLQEPVVAFAVGWVIITLLSVVPVLGFVLMMVTALWGFGAALMALFARSKQERPPAPLAPVAPTYPVYVPTAVTMPAGAPVTGPFVATAEPPVAAFTPGAVPFATAPLPGVPPVQPSLTSEAMMFPRASFWQRMAAGFLDLILIGVVSGILDFAFVFLVVTVAYFTAMWAWKGTTIGGIVVGLKVVRFDGRRLDWTVGLVRALAAWLSTMVMFLGFFWIAWDPERQGWHDRIAGTVVLKLPRGTPLLAL